MPKPRVKVDKRAKRKRLNRRLRKLLSPKNAIMVLNELRVNVKYTVFPPMNVLATPVFMAHAELNGVTHEGRGVSKALAKQKAAEHALKELLLAKVTSYSTHVEEDPPVDNPGGNPGGADGDDLADVDDKDIATGKDGMPWRHLASYALYKMILEWQVDAPTSVNTGNTPKEHRPLRKMPDKATAKLRDPVMLLCQLVPGIKFVETDRTGRAPKIEFTVEVEVQERKFYGYGTNKKLAKKGAAKKALTAVYKVIYDD